MFTPKRQKEAPPPRPSFAQYKASLKPSDDFPVHQAAWANDLERLKALVKPVSKQDSATSGNSSAVEAAKAAGNSLHFALQLEDVDAAADPYHINALDNNGNSCAHIALYLGHDSLLNYLLACGADPRTKNSAGWSLCKEAIVLRRQNLALDLVLAAHKRKWDSWQRRLPVILAHLETIPDFYMEIFWEFRSWVPFVARFLPHDTIRIWKKGASFRMDTTLREFVNMKWVRGNVSFLFDGNDPDPTTRGTFYLMDHDRKLVSNALYELQFPNRTLLEYNSDLIMAGDQAVDGDFDTTGMTFKRRTSWLGRDKSADISGYPSAIYDMKDFKMTMTRRALKVPHGADSPTTPATPLSDSDEDDSDDDDNFEDAETGEGKGPAQPIPYTASAPPVTASSTSTPPKKGRPGLSISIPETSPAAPVPDMDDPEIGSDVSPEDMDDLTAANAAAEELKKQAAQEEGVERTVRVEGDYTMKTTTKNFKGAVWMTDEFPLDLEQVLPLFEALAPTSRQFSQLNQFMSTKLPAGFPVQLELPVFPTITASVTFQSCTLQDVDANQVRLPADFSIWSSAQIERQLLKDYKKNRQLRDNPSQSKSNDASVRLGFGSPVGSPTSDI